MSNSFDDFVDDTGNIVIREDLTLVRHVEQNVADNGDDLAYRYVDYSRERDGEVHELTWSQFGARLRAVAARLQQVTSPGDRVAILAPQGLDYVVAFFGAVYAGTIAVPLFDPDEPGHSDRLHAVLNDCSPSAILTATNSAAGVRQFFRALPAAQRPRIIAVDAIPDSVGATWTEPPTDIDAIAYLQYTSGSTRVPAGVEITHRAVGVNALQMVDAIELNHDSRGVTWLPLFHDMGLLTVILPALGGKYITIMSPRAFVQRPWRWIKELAAVSDGAGTFAAAPNFAFEHAAQRGLPKNGESLDLSNVIGLINGSEPVTTTSMKKFNDAFMPYGLPKTAIKPSYGMAEATLFVSSTKHSDEAKVIHVDRTELNSGRVVQVAEGTPNSIPQVSCGYVARSQWAAIVDADSASEVPDGHVGEIWLHGENIGKGYWGREKETSETFHNKLVSRQTENSHADGAAEGANWMRTGDFGVYVDGELYITGRVKDLVIVDGRNHYPQDLEASAQDASTALRPGFVAAFAVPANQLPDFVFEHGGAGLTRDPGDSSEQLVIVAERAPGAGKADPQPIADTVRAAISTRHGVTARDILLVPAGSIPRTSSGKIARRACKAAYIEGTLRGGYQQTAFPDNPED
ncbi:AMP-binding protein [Rhodococcus sp. BP-149]|uniref:long-chain-fatty-acid--AMP ligase FadD32 n=1 Tax=unclassified Rhodococcus (in: high G+C Gram-positive bacteria) TaxID=192944 RepID=UPI001C9B892A|nr:MULTISPECIES: long-chain-fatty-acid--AMP ligase FadD32 [unclassified Rhodococcus (in: high G+C Gram-positive bacteria)]MBY6687723.1 AMP-binding protein [Rhodococcus sp. BP-288]MBY6695878.1 AMP-binding protein [Rhodococcus sp. BP-188]MBY6700314.1 AMP-binding protein [Rhodococcus sp. BP-285]MBY6704663.1 AMP-binding protein [Rhodococcus sp. BP-283]MBY6713439.1 AMP-binding protein [Rhodococcus sp. BP-160]